MTLPFAVYAINGELKLSNSHMHARREQARRSYVFTQRLKAGAPKTIDPIQQPRAVKQQHNSSMINMMNSSEP